MSLAEDSFRYYRLSIFLNKIIKIKRYFNHFTSWKALKPQKRKILLRMKESVYGMSENNKIATLNAIVDEE